jgi:hypothetical protein
MPSLQIPEHFKINTPIEYDRSVIKTEIVEVYPACGMNQQNLNSADAQLRFILNSENRFFHLSSNKSGFRVRVGFITKANGGANDRTTKCTLVSNWFGHMFGSAKFSLCGRTIEHIQNLGVAMDIMYHMKRKEFRLDEGELCGFIPDTDTGGAGYTSTLKTVTMADAAAAVTALSNKTLTVDDAYNKGFKRRLNLYNYTVAADDVVRYAECFVPLSSIFGFVDEYDRLMKYVSLEIELIRQITNAKIYFGTDGTSISFGDPNTTGLLHIVLELESVTPSPQYAIEMDNDIKEPILITYLERTCINRVAGQTQTFDITETRFSCPKYIFIVCMKNNRNLFRHSDVSYVQVVVDSETYPNLQQNTKFVENRYTKFYQSFSDIARYFDAGVAISMKEYKELYTIFGVDVSNQKEKIRGVNSNISMRISRNAIPANDNDATNPQSTEYFILFLTEKSLKYNALSGQIEEILV